MSYDREKRDSEWEVYKIRILALDSSSWSLASLKRASSDAKKKVLSAVVHMLKDIILKE